jgi:hypothetical protein
MSWRPGVVLLLVWMPLSNADAQEMNPQEPEMVNGDRRFTVVAGVGNAMGWFGVQGEKYFQQERISFFVGFGYTPEDDLFPGGPTLAVGVRGFTSGSKHRAFLEASVSQVTTTKYAAHPPDGQRLYGPGLQVGYQYTAAGGFTLMASAGAGYAVGQELIEPLDEPDPIYALIGLGLGYTWKQGGSIRR